MGPIALFDKSFLQSLSVDESVWFDHYFSGNVCPIFYIETLADLKKPDTGKRSPEEHVRIIADKFPEKNGQPNAYHLTASTANLLGLHIPNNGQIVIPGMRQIIIEGHPVAAAPEPPECEAFRRWQDSDVQAVEKIVAGQWRSSPLGFSTEQVISELSNIGISVTSSLQSFRDILALTDDILGQLSPERQLALAASLLGVEEACQDQIVAAWCKAEPQSLKEYAWYSAHVFRVELFFHLAVQNSRIGAGSRMDIMYLFYAPFCQVFVSFDWIHEECAPLFLRDDQVYVRGTDMKASLKRINDHFQSLPESAKERGLDSIAPLPPNIDSHVETLWDRFCPSWRTQTKKPVEAASETLEFLRKHGQAIKALIRAPRVAPVNASAEPDMLVFQRTAHRRRGSWWQLPQERSKPS